MDFLKFIIDIPRIVLMLSIICFILIFDYDNFVMSDKSYFFKKIDPSIHFSIIFWILLLFYFNIQL
jgi:hypothetical protein